MYISLVGNENNLLDLVITYASNNILVSPFSNIVWSWHDITDHILLCTNNHLEFLTAILTADTKEGLLWTATIILQSYYSRFAIWPVFQCFRIP